MPITRARLVQERWLSLLRWLLLAAATFQLPGAASLREGSFSAAADSPLSLLLVGFAVYAALVAVLTLVLSVWPTAATYGTSFVDLAAATGLVAVGGGDIGATEMVGVGVAGAALALRGLPLVDTLLFGVGLMGALAAVGLSPSIMRGEVELEWPRLLGWAGLSSIPVLIRVVALPVAVRPTESPLAQLAQRAERALGRLGEVEDSSLHVLAERATAVAAEATGSAMAGLIVHRPEGGLELYTFFQGKAGVQRLSPQQEERSLAVRLAAVERPVILTPADDLRSRGLPEQYPAVLDSVLAVPVGQIGADRGTLFVVNRSRGYGLEEQLLMTLLASDLARRVLAAQALQSAAERQTVAMEALLAAVDARRPGTRARGERCARLAAAIAQEMAWPEDAMEELRVAAILHDVGEIAVPDSILDKDEPLTPDEAQLMRQHPIIAARMIDTFNRSPLVLAAVYSHHERWDGHGYPRGLAGEDIPVEARVLGLADAVQAMLEPQAPGAVDPADVVQRIILGSGTQYDPSVVQALLAVLRREGHEFLRISH